MGMHEKIPIKRNRFGIWGLQLGAAVPCHTFQTDLFTRNICHADTSSVPLYWTAQKFFSFKVDDTRKIFKNSTYLAFWGKLHGATPTNYTFLERFFNGATSQRVCLYLEPLESYKALKLTTLGGAPGGGTTVPCCTFLEKSRRASVQL